MRAAKSLVRGARRFVPYVAAAVTLVVVLFYAVFPTRTYLDQRAITVDTKAALEEVALENEVLTERIEALHTDSEVERLAREQFQLVRPGEEPFAVLPPPPRPVTIPNTWPFSVLAESVIE